MSRQHELRRAAQGEDPMQLIELLRRIMRDQTSEDCGPVVAAYEPVMSMARRQPNYAAEILLAYIACAYQLALGVTPRDERLVEVIRSIERNWGSEFPAVKNSCDDALTQLARW